MSKRLSHDSLLPCFLTNLLSTIHYSFFLSESQKYLIFWCKDTRFFGFL